jgi:hypothetical protein
MQATQPRPGAQPNHQAFFLTAYRDHLLTELAEVQRRLAECEAAPTPARTKATGLEY